MLISEESKKKLKTGLVQALECLEGVRVERVEVNSRGIFLDVTDEKKKALIEINVLSSLHLPSEPLSTASLSEKYSLGGRIVATMSLPEAFAHKIAATLERDALRDLFDLSQMAEMTAFDVDTLEQRFSKLMIQRSKPKPISFAEAAQLLKQRLDEVDQKRIEIELYPLLPMEYRPGILGVMRASVGRIVQNLVNWHDKP